VYNPVQFRAGYGVNDGVYNSVFGRSPQTGEIKDYCAHIISGSTKQYGIPLTTLDAIDHIDIAIDGADEVDPQKEFD